MSAIRICFFSLVFLLGFQVAQAQSSNDANPFDGQGFYTKQKTLLVYHQAELLSMGFVTGSVIDTICFQINSRNSASPYFLEINYYYTNSFFIFNYPFTIFPPVTNWGGGAFVGQLDMSYIASPFYLPSSGGLLKIPLLYPIVWTGSTDGLVIEICWNTSSANSTDSINAIQLPATETKVLRLKHSSSFTTGCTLTLTPGSGVTANISEWRPNIFLCNPQPVAVNSENLQDQLFTINSIVATSENMFEVNFISPDINTYAYQIRDVIGKTVLKKANVKSKAGNNILQISHHLNRGIYFVSLTNEKKSITRKFLIN